MNYIANLLTRVSVSQGLESEYWDMKMWVLVATAYQLSSERFNVVLV